MRTAALAVMVIALGACRDAVSGVGNEAPNPESAISATIGRDGGLVRTPNGYAAVRIPAGALESDVTVTLERVNTTYPPGRGPLRTNHVQYGAAYRLTMSPAPILSRLVTVALCAGEGRPFEGPDEVHHRLKYVFSLLGEEGDEAVVAPASGADLSIVNCAARTADRGLLGRLFAAFEPKLLYAIDLGGGGEAPGYHCTTPCSVMPAPFAGLIIGVIDTGAYVQ